MSNTASVFAQFNDFDSGDPELPQCYYYPSSMMPLSDDAKKTALNPKFVDLPKTPEECLIANSQPTPSSENIDTSGSTKYNESWHDTTVNTTIEHSEGDHSAISRKNVIDDLSIDDSLITDLTESEKHNTGTLAKFIQRFREQPAQPRKKRLNNDTKSNEFWWLNSSPIGPNISTVTTESSVVNTPISSVTTPSKRVEASFKGPFMERKRENTDSETNRIQLRASKLLELSENTLSSSFSSQYSSSPRSVPSQRNKPARQSKTLSSNNNKSIPRYVETKFTPSSPEPSKHTSTKKFTEKPLRPEDDILYQWRLSRKMELAKTTNKKNPFLNKREEHTMKETDTNNEKRLCISKPIREVCIDSYKENVVSVASNQCSCSLNSAKSTSFPIETKQDNSCNKNSEVSGNSVNCTSFEDVPPHLHSICDILPCLHERRQTTQIASVLNKEVKIQSKVDSERGSSETNKTMNDNYESNVFYHVMEKRAKQTSTMKQNEKSTLTNNVAKPCDKISPAINQIISERLFEQTENSTLNDPRLTSIRSHNGQNYVISQNGPKPVTIIDSYNKPKGVSATQRNSRNIVSSARKNDSFLPSSEDTTTNVLLDSSSDEDFTADEILRELRARRAVNKKRLRLVIDALSECD